MLDTQPKAEAAVIALRPATKDDADHLARLVNYAGEGLPLYFWSRAAKEADQPARDGSPRDPWEIGRERAQRETGAFSYRHATMAVVAGEIAGCLIAYPIADEPEPVYLDAMPPMFVPIQQLESLAPGTHYVSVLAVHPELRGRGIGRQLLAEAERAAGGRTMSIIVSDGNPGARRLYDRAGYRSVASRPMVKDAWANEGENWVLMLKPTPDRSLA